VGLILTISLVIVVVSEVGSALARKRLT